MGTCMSTREKPDKEMCCEGSQEPVATVLSSLQLSKADREKLRQFECKMKSTIGELRETAEQAKQLQEENTALKLDLRSLEAQNAALKAELGRTKDASNGIKGASSDKGGVFATATDGSSVAAAAEAKAAGAGS